MYTGLLSDALQASAGRLTRDALIDRVVESRVLMLSARVGPRPTAYELLAREIAYDVSLIRLCDELGFTVGVRDFVDPRTERARIEGELLQTWGLDVCALSRARRQTTRLRPIDR